MSEQDKSVDDLIGSLTDELQPVKPMAHPLLRGIPFLAVIILYGAFIVHSIGLRGDISSIIHEMYFVFEVGISALIMLFGMVASAFLCIPDMRGQKWAIPVAFTLSGVLILWTIDRGIVEGFAPELFSWHHCLYDGSIMGFIPAAAVVFLSLGGKTTRPMMMAAMNVLAVTAMGYIGLRFTCSMDNIEHAFLFHLTPFALLAFVLGVGARRLYNW